MQENSNTGLVAGIVAVTVVIFAGLAWLIASAPGGTGTPITPQDENVTFFDEQDPFLGATNTKVLVHMYGDFQCPACRAAEPGLKYAISTYQDRVRFIWKDFPLTQIHANGRIAAEAARCAQTQDRFWDYHEKLYDAQPEWAAGSNPKEKLVGYAQGLGLSAEAFSRCLDNQSFDARVTGNMSEGTRNNVDATPTFFVNQRRYFGMTPAQWDQTLQDALRRAN